MKLALAHAGRPKLRSAPMLVVSAALLLSVVSPVRADGLLDKLSQTFRQGPAEGDVNGALTLPFYWKLVDGPTQRGISGVTSSVEPYMRLPLRIAQGLPSVDEWVQRTQLAEPLKPAEDETLLELFTSWRASVLSLPSKLTATDSDMQTLLKSKRLQVFTLADAGSTPNDGRRDDAAKRYQVIARSLNKSAYFVAVNQSDGWQRLLASKLEQKIDFVRRMSANQAPQFRAAQMDAYQALYGSRYFEPTAAELLRYDGLLALLNAVTQADAERVAADYRGKLDAIRVAAEAENRQSAPFVSEQGTVEVLRKLVAVDAELQRSLDAWITRPSSKPGDLWHLLPYCLSQMPPLDVLRRNLNTATEFDRTVNSGTRTMLGGLSKAIATVPAELPAAATAALGSLRAERERLSFAFLHYTAWYTRSERDRPDPQLVEFYKAWIPRVSALQTPEVWNACIEWRSAQFKVSDARWNAKSYAPRDLWKPASVSALLSAADENSARQMMQTLKANANSFGDLVASQSAWKQNDRQNQTRAEGRLFGALDALRQASIDADREECKFRQQQPMSDLNRINLPDCDKLYPAQK